METVHVHTRSPSGAEIVKVWSIALNKESIFIGHHISVLHLRRMKTQSIGWKMVI